LLLRWRAPPEVMEVLSHDRDEIADLPGTPRLQLRDSGVAAAESRRPWIHYGERTVLVEYWTGSGRVVRPSLGAKLLVGQHSACTRFEGLTRGCGQRPGEPFALVVVHSAGVRGVEG
jgi:hypothetical protein